MNRPTAVEMFCGVGGMTLGFRQAGFRILAAVDNDPINVKLHRKNFSKCATICADVRNLSGPAFQRLTKLQRRRVDVLIGGPPCQGFSLIGKRRVDDERNQLVLAFVRWVRSLKPRYFVMENVPGFLSGNGHHILNSFLARARRAGYGVVTPIRILNAADFGVPQRRRRAFVLGYRLDMPAPSYPEASPLRDADGNLYCPTVWDAISDLPDVDTLEDALSTDRFTGEVQRPSYYAQLLRGEINDPNDKSRLRSCNGHGLGGCLRTNHTAATVLRFQATAQGTYESGSRCFRLEARDISPTLRAGTGPAQGSFTAARPIHPTFPRCITVREAARLHSFPDWFEFHATKWHGFRQIGNSVPPFLARAVAKAVHDVLTP